MTPPISLSDDQLNVVMTAARPIDDPEKREVFLWRVSARLQLARRIDDAAVASAVQLALRGLVHAVAE